MLVCFIRLATLYFLLFAMVRKELSCRLAGCTVDLCLYGMPLIVAQAQWATFLGVGGVLRHQRLTSCYGSGDIETDTETERGTDQSSTNQTHLER